MANDDAIPAATAPVAIIGFGVAGFNAAVAMRRAGYSGEIEIFSNLGTLPYSPILTSYYAGGMRSYEECFPWSEEDVRDIGATIHRECPVEELDVDARLIRTPKGDHPYSKCLVATGSSPCAVGFPADCGYDPILLHTMDDAERLRSALLDPSCEHVLVSGASMVALKTVEACLARGKEVTLVGMNPHVLDFNSLEAAAIRFEKGLEAKGVNLRLGQTISDVEVDEDIVGGPTSGTPSSRVLRVTFSNGDVRSFDEIAVAHGMRSNLSFITPGSIEMDAGLLVDEFMRTSDPDVYAAGDVAQALELISGTPKIVGIWKNAAIQGACAGCAIAAEMAGVDPDEGDSFKGSISTNTIAVDGTLFISAGTIDPGPDGKVEVIEDDLMTVVYIYRKQPEDGRHQLVGFNLTSDTDVKGSVAYDTGAMLTMRILEGLRAQ